LKLHIPTQILKTIPEVQSTRHDTARRSRFTDVRWRYHCTDRLNTVVCGFWRHLVQNLSISCQNHCRDLYWTF